MGRCTWDAALGTRPKRWRMPRSLGGRVPSANCQKKFGRLRLVPKSGLSAELLGRHRGLFWGELEDDAGALLLEADADVDGQRAPAAAEGFLFVAFDDLADGHWHAQLVGELDRQVGVFGGQERRKAGVFEVATEQLLREGVDDGATRPGAHTDDRCERLQIH